MLAAFALVIGPVPVEQSGDNPRFHLVFSFVFQLALIAGVVGAAFGKHAGKKYDMLSVWRDGNSSSFRRQLRHLPLSRAVLVHAPNLRRSAARGNEVDAPGIRRPTRARVGSVLRNLFWNTAIHRLNVNLIR